ncbi:MAG: PBP1A family penicillin-binding protein [Acidobacteriota bacterium]|nr:PBP1A family penicillin-binding protein [Acidobacteriota bacterium]
MSHYVVRYARHAGIAALFVVAAILGSISGVLFAYAGDLPQIKALDHYNPGTITRVYARDGQVIGEFATQHRDVIGYDDISPLLREAIISTEDADFNHHFGVNLWRIFVAAVTDIVKWRRDQGASTITQQLARNLNEFGLTQQKLFERKIKEQILAIQIEKRYTKQEILTMYCNQIYLGHGAYGVEAASRLYFGTHAKDLTLPEAAMIAGIIQSPTRESPFVSMRRALQRRNYSLQRMADEGYITQAQADKAKAQPIVLARQARQDLSVAPYFVEEVRQHLEKEYGAKQLYEGGLSVQTSLDVRLQKAADAAVDRGLRNIDKVRGWRRPTDTVFAGKDTIAGYSNARWAQPMAPGDIVPAVVVALTGPRHQNARLRIAEFHADLTPRDFTWTHRAAADQLMKPGDVVQVAIRKVDAAKKTMEVRLDQQPLIQGALLAIDNHTGQILAMVGGDDFERSKFNRALQAMRQLGSTFKPIVYTAAIDRGYTPVSIIQDEPVSFPQGPGLPDYEPRNYDRIFEGPITLRHALEDSRNVPAVRMMNQLTPPVVLSYAKRFGLKEDIPPYLSVALGAAESTLLEMTSAYSVFPNQGVRMVPYEILKVQDRDGNLLEQHRPQPIDVIRADTAYVMTNLLRGVVLRGTGAADAAIDWPLAGKTGTTDNYSDAWFIGFDPNITVGVWVGFDEKKPIFNNATGAVAALPIWTEFIKDYIRGLPDRNNPPSFQVPGNIVYVSVDKTTGAPEPPGTAGAINEAFIAGTQPGATSFLGSTTPAPVSSLSRPQPQPQPQPQDRHEPQLQHH